MFEGKIWQPSEDVGESNAETIRIVTLTEPTPGSTTVGEVHRRFASMAVVVPEALALIEKLLSPNFDEEYIDDIHDKARDILVRAGRRLP